MQKFIVIILLILIVYSKAVTGNFLTADDLPGIVNNPEVLQLNFKAWYLFVYSALHMIFGFNSFFYHMYSLILHIANMLLFYILIKKLFNDKTAFIATFLYSIHPVVFEAVGWISGMGYLVYGFLTFLSLNIAIRWGFKGYLGSLIFYSFALIIFKDPWHLAIPFIIGITLFFQSQSLKTTIVKFMPFAGISMLFFMLYIQGAISSRITGFESIHYFDIAKQTPLGNRIFFSLYKSIELLVFPINLTIYQEGYEISQFYYAVMTAISLLYLAIMYKAFFKWKNLFYIQSGILLGALPIYLPNSFTWFIAERYLYVSTGFFCILLALVIQRASQKKAKYGILIFSFLFLFYSGRTYIRSYAFQNDKTLWIATYKTSPLSYKVHNNLGYVYETEGNFAKSEEHYLRAIEIFPAYSDAMHNLGLLYLKEKKVEAAKNMFHLALKHKPSLYQSAYKLYEIYKSEGNKTLEVYYENEFNKYYQAL